MRNVHTVRIYSRQDPLAQRTFRLAKALGLTNIEEIRTVKVYRLEGIDEHQTFRLVEELLYDRVSEVHYIDGETFPSEFEAFEVGYKPGVMNPEVESIMKAAQDLEIPLIAADSSTMYRVRFNAASSAMSMQGLKNALINKTTQREITEEPKTLLIENVPGVVQTVTLRVLNDARLIEVSKERELHLNLDEMKVIAHKFLELGRDPTDAELETLAQTWSEHCKHKTFSARILHRRGVGDPTPLFQRLKDEAKRHRDGVISIFDDNAGVIDFFEDYGISGKVETHNSPSAAEPYGGAMTGTGGVLRDIAGTGQGMKVLLSTDMFCFAPPDLPANEVPPGCLPPQNLLTNCVRGVGDYGNRMGVPTANGSFHFHPDFRAKPSVIVGAYGIAKKEFCYKGKPKPDDFVIVVGGKTGRDGIHGATFSSGEMTSTTAQVNASAVQIGNAIEEKRTFDALEACRDRGYIRAVTDCGAGGLSSAIGEMASEIGVRVDLTRVPLKYSGLAPWEIWISESQERMVCAVSPGYQQSFLDICRRHNVEATIVGFFTGDKHLHVHYNGQSVCDLSMEFLHHGLPQRVMVADWKRPDYQTIDIPELGTPEEWNSAYVRVMSDLNICSKQSIVRRYDHGVQGTNVLPPYGGVNLDAPNDAVVLRPLLDKDYGMVVSHGINPILNKIDPHQGAWWAIAEAIANYVAVGGDLSRAALIDNFITAFPDEDTMGALEMMMDACVDVMRITGIPFVSGKDSLSSTYRFPNDEVLKIPPVLCVSMFGAIKDVNKTISADFKRSDSAIFLVGNLNPDQMGGSVYLGGHDFGGKSPVINPRAMEAYAYGLSEAIQRGEILSCHDISEGGVAVALAEMCLGGNIGAVINLERLEQTTASRLDFLFFNEMAGTYLIEVSKEKVPNLNGLAIHNIGYTIPAEEITAIDWDDEAIFSIPLSTLREAWKRPLEEVFK